MMKKKKLAIARSISASLFWFYVVAIDLFWFLHSVSNTLKNDGQLSSSDLYVLSSNFARGFSICLCLWKRFFFRFALTFVINSHILIEDKFIQYRHWCFCTRSKGDFETELTFELLLYLTFSTRFSLHRLFFVRLNISLKFVWSGIRRLVGFRFSIYEVVLTDFKILIGRFLFEVVQILLSNVFNTIDLLIL